MKKFTVKQFKKYLESQDSLGDIHFNLSEENIEAANKPKVLLPFEEVGEGYVGIYNGQYKIKISKKGTLDSLAKCNKYNKYDYDVLINHYGHYPTDNAVLFRFVNNDDNNNNDDEYIGIYLDEVVCLEEDN